MNKKFTSLLAWALCCLTSTSAWALDKNADGVYQIGNADQLIEFAKIVNGIDGEAETAANAELTADIDMTGKTWTPIGDNDHRYTGTFNGNYHVIDNLKIEGGDKIGIFGVVNGGCVIKNLVAGAGNEVKGGSMIGGIIGASDGSGWVELQNVGHEGYVEGTGANCCAIIGVVMNGGPATRILDCYNTGDIKGGWESAIITGWFGGHGSVEVKGFWNTGKVLNGQDGGSSLWRNGSGITAERIFHLYADQGATVIADGDLASGKLAYALNDNQDAGVWRQNLEGDNKDTQPTFLPSHAQVYANGVLQCDGITPKEGSDLTFSNHSGSSVDDHVFDGGFCTVCGKWQEDFLTADENGFFNIANGAQLNWFAYLVNIKGEGASNALLTVDIDMTDLDFTPIGQDNKDYKGHFNGQGHRILNLVTSADKQNQALFGQAVGGAVIENIIIDKSCVMQGTAFTAGILGHVWGDGVIVRNCGNEADIIGSAQNSAGIVGCSERKVTIENCYNMGSIIGSHENAGICAWMGANESIIRNCWSTASNINGAALWRKDEVKGQNMWQIEGQQGTAFTEAEMQSGEFCYKLNGNSSENVVWFQKIGTENHPMPFGTDVVYANGNLQCDGITPVEGGVVTFSNTEGSVVAEHNFNDWGFCKNCDALQPDYLTANAEGYFELGNTKHLNWFANYATIVDQQANALLTADIDMLNVYFPGIGFDGKAFSGTLDGQTHIIKNLVMDMPEEDNVGLIRDITAGAVVKNITIDATCSFKGKKFTGAFVGHASGNGAVQLEQLGNEADVETVDQNAGAIVGCNTSGELKLTVVNCYNTGTITSGWEAGGLSGWFGNDAVTTNCYNMGIVVNGESFARGNNIQITNCFDPVTNWPALPSSPIEDFTNGTIFKALSEAAPGIWFLSAETGGHPVLYNTGITTGIASPSSILSSLSSSTYNLNGQRVKQAQKGLYIINGRKVVIK